MKKIISLALILVLCLALAVPAFAVGGDEYFRFIDVAELLTEAQQDELNAKLDKLSETLQFDITVITMDTLDGQESDPAAVELYEHCNYGFGDDKSGVILLISMEERDWRICGFGFGQKAINDDAGAYIGELITPDLTAGNYFTAFSTYAETCASLVNNAMNGDFYKAPFGVGTSLIIAVVVGLILALIVTGSMKGQLKSVHQKTAAADYVVPGSLHVTEARERFLYHTVTRSAKPKNNSSGSSGSHSSAGGKF